MILSLTVTLEYIIDVFKDYRAWNVKISRMSVWLHSSCLRAKIRSSLEMSVADGCANFKRSTGKRIVRF